MGKIKTWGQPTELVGKNHTVTIYLSDVVKYQAPIVAIHGMFGTSIRWRNYADFFTKLGFEFITPTLRLHQQGNRLPELGRTSVNDYVDDIKTLIKYLMRNGRSRPIVMGHSMGGLIAQKIAEAGLAEKLVLLNSAPPAGVPLHPDLSYQIAIARYLPWILLHKPFKPSLKIYSRFIINNMPKEQWPALHKYAVYESGRAAKEMRFGKIKVDFQKINCLTLIIGCFQDRIVPPLVAVNIRQKIKYALTALWHYPQFAHWIQCEPGWEEPAKDIAKWLIRK